MYEDESTLIEGLRNKEETAFRTAIRQYQASMKYLALSIVGDKIADEVVQEAWFSVIKAIGRFEGRSSLKTWILRIVANEAKTRLRKESRLTSLEALTREDETMAARFDHQGHWRQPPETWNADSPEALLSSEEMKDCMDLMISTLPDLQRATLVLREQQDFSLREICNILEVSESNVRVLLHRARNRVFRCIEHFQQTGNCKTEG